MRWVQDRVHLGGAHDAIEDRVVGVRLHELGPLERQARFLGVESHDHLDLGKSFELLREVTAPERAEPGDENAHRGLPEPHAAAGSQHVV